MNHLRIIPKRGLYTNFITKRPLGFYMIPYENQWESRDNENEIRVTQNNENEIRFSTPYKSYGEWVKENQGITNSKERQIKMKEYLDKFYSK
jgi:hypothetical protein